MALAVIVANEHRAGFELAPGRAAGSDQAAHLEDAMLRRLSKRRQTRLEADIRLQAGRLGRARQRLPIGAVPPPSGDRSLRKSPA